jgi:hypothetical protein
MIRQELSQVMDIFLPPLKFPMQVVLLQKRSIIAHGVQEYASFPVYFLFKLVRVIFHKIELAEEYQVNEVLRIELHNQE